MLADVVQRRLHCRHDLTCLSRLQLDRLGAGHQRRRIGDCGVQRSAQVDRSVDSSFQVGQRHSDDERTQLLLLLGGHRPQPGALPPDVQPAPMDERQRLQHAVVDDAGQPIPLGDLSLFGQGQAQGVLFLAGDIGPIAQTGAHHHDQARVGQWLGVENADLSDHHGGDDERGDEPTAPAKDEGDTDDGDVLPHSRDRRVPCRRRQRGVDPPRRHHRR